jgi:hypothetical protein
MKANVQARSPRARIVGPSSAAARHMAGLTHAMRGPSIGTAYGRPGGHRAVLTVAYSRTTGGGSVTLLGVLLPGVVGDVVGPQLAH